MPNIVFRSHVAYLQGSALGPLGFIAKTKDLTAASETHIVHSHVYADDKLYDSSTVVDAASVRDRPTVCTSDVARRCASNRLQLNPDKTEITWFGSRFSLPNFNASANRSKSELITFSQAASSVRDLGIHLDSELIIKQHVAKTAAACFYHMRRLR